MKISRREIFIFLLIFTTEVRGRWYYRPSNTANVKLEQRSGSYPMMKLKRMSFAESGLSDKNADLKKHDPFTFEYVNFDEDDRMKNALRSKTYEPMDFVMRKRDEYYMPTSQNRQPFKSLQNEINLENDKEKFSKFFNLMGTNPMKIKPSNRFEMERLPRAGI